MGIITSIFEAISSVISGFLDVLSNLFGGLIDLFWTAGADGSGGSLTILGILLIIGVAAPLVFWGLNWIVSLFKRMLANRKGK